MTGGVKKPHVKSMDLVRAVTIVSVVAVHSTWYTAGGSSSFTAGLVLNWLHFTREAFMALTGFVLTYSVIDRPPEWARFWSKRYRLVLFPYLIWSALYIALKVPLWPLSGYVLAWLISLPTGSAWFHLYYLLITMQFYLVFPLFLGLMRWARRFPWRVLGSTLIFEVLLMTYDQYGLHGSGLGINRYTGVEVWTYAWYFVLGGVVAVHWPQVSAWLLRHIRQLGTGLLGAGLFSAVTYVVQEHVTGSVDFADAVLQPSTIVFASTLFFNLVAWGLVTEQSARQLLSHSSLIQRISDRSFGIYLLHPMILAGLMYGWGLLHSAINPWLLDAFTVTLVVTISYQIIGLIGRTRLSPWIIGRAAYLVRQEVALGKIAPLESIH